jgi:hemerythrin-like metal-binding protein
MAHIQWKERYSIHYKEVDAQHKRLLDVLNHLLDLIECKRPPDEITGIFHRLCAYALDHFALEEHYLAGCAYPGLDQQKGEHTYFVQRVLEFNDRYDPSDPALLVETFKFLKDWYLGHILRSDMDYVPWVRRYYREAPIRGVVIEREGLLARMDRTHFLDQLTTLTERTREELDHAVFGASLFDDLCSGALDRGLFLEELSAVVGTTLSEGQVVELFSSRGEELDELADLLQILKSRVKLGLVADAHPWNAERIRSQRNVFDAVSLSCETKSRVPDRRILNDILDQLGLMSEECIFLTSLPDHAEIANAQLLHGRMFEGSAHLLEWLEKRSG